MECYFKWIPRRTFSWKHIYQGTRSPKIELLNLYSLKFLTREPELFGVSCSNLIWSTVDKTKEKPGPTWREVKQSQKYARIPRWEVAYLLVFSVHTPVDVGCRNLISCYRSFDAPWIGWASPQVWGLAGFRLCPEKNTIWLPSLKTY